ncbi:glutathione-regulated potassium-efflux system protein KefC [Paucibacter sp. TC2R-5]|uniref:glutathione-regulated potassium-efflux system protein KefC n=1 Tax=Paucibacter sp. TC2R-5 TaxID=2893555 RepID=UPI0021E48EE9|nr:glutathione-regulated potassium-efflux system protein KefC [Paucibacter sp. TC2R-5]MCV2358540.1 glutathione-regulated potassium-efflux system protein KefC [Paucibacter sp. TC2R-5]
MEHHSWLNAPLVYLGAAVVAVPLARFLGLGSILGYLAAGIVIGPGVLGWVSDAGAILEFAEFGVVLMMFLVGLELEPRRLWAMRRPIFVWGNVQLLGSAALMCLAAVALGVPWRVALVASIGLAMSSTAVAMAVLGERNLAPTSAGQGILSVALLQDIAAIPLLALIPLLAMGGDSHPQGSAWLSAAKAVGVIAAIVLGGRLLLRPALRWIACSKTPEIFTAAALLLVVATASLMQAVGLSMALGAFLAGVLLAESEYRHELETDIEPFKGLLLGLFFIAVGMGLDLNVLREQPLLIAALLTGLLLIKAVVLLLMARWMPLPLMERPVFVILLAQGGEFGFVVFQTATQAGILSAGQSSTLVAAVALSLLCTPALLLISQRWVEPWLAKHCAPKPALKEIDQAQDAPIIIAGFGRYGQIVGRLLYAKGLPATVLEHDSEMIETVRKFGWQPFYGDATRLDLLRTAGAAKARVLVLAIDDVAQSLQLAALAREHFPQLQIVARARNVQHYYGLRDLGVSLIERETLDAALASASSVLELMGLSPTEARDSAQRFRRHNVAQLEELYPHHHDQAQLIAMTKQGRQQLEEQFAQEREMALQQGDKGWIAQPPVQAQEPEPTLPR